VTGLRVAAGQAVAVAGDIQANVETAARLTREAGAEGATLLVLPEAFLTGYDFGVFAGELPSDEELEDPWLEPLRHACTETNCTVVVSVPLRRGTQQRLSMLVLRSNGTVVAPYDKQHLDGDERDHFTPGDHGASIEVDGHELALSICYDGSFPEHAAAAAADGAIGYLASAAFFAGSEERRDITYAARAADNGMYVVLAAATGPCGDLEFVGGTAIYDPEGHSLGLLGTEEGLVVADLDPAVVRRIRTKRTMLDDRLPDLGPRVRA
jgi:predicted amidohydrolase